MAMMQQPFESQLRELILQEGINEPLVFRGIHKNWDPCTWTLDMWGECFKDERLSVRYGKRNWNGLQPQWESECGRTDMTWKEIIDWQKGDYKFLPEGGTSDDLWIYYDYRYLPDVFNSVAGSGSSKDERDFLKIITFNENLKKKFCWNKLGFPERNSDHSTLWIGSHGANTPCHFDTYSCNLVCQVFGRKRWTLFPPQDTNNLSPTRIPYEESSVYSRINFSSQKRLVSHAQELQKCTPYQITLEAGDCLFLPQKWWHFVQSEDFSVSVNTWIELPGDHTARLEEAILRTVTSTVVNMTFPDAAKLVLNPNEMDVADMSEMDLNDMLQAASSAYIENQRKQMLVEEDDVPETGSSCTDRNAKSPTRKKSKMSNLTLPEFLSCYPSVSTVSPISFQALLQNQEGSETNGVEIDAVRSPSYLEHLINAIGHPTILKGIADQFLKNVTQNPPK